MSDAAQLRMPMTVGQILDRIYRLLRANLSSLIGVAAVPGAMVLVTYGILFAVMGIMIFPAMQSGKAPVMPQLVIASLAGFLIMLLVQLTVFALYLAAASYAAVQADRGTRVTFRESYEIAWSRALHYVLLILAMYAVCFLPALLLELPMFGAMAWIGSTKATPSALTILLFLIGFLLFFGAMVGGMVVALRLSLAFPASVFEFLKVRQAIKRSWALTRGALGRIFLVLLVVYAAVYVAMMVVMTGAMSVAAIGYLVFSSTHVHPTTHTIWFLAICVALAYLTLISLFSACSWAGFATALAVIYNDQRMRIDSPPPHLAPTGASG